MEGNTLYLIDFNCVIDTNGNPMGHTLGVTRMLIDLLKDSNVKIVYVSSPEYADCITNISCMPILKSLKRGDGVARDEKQIVKYNFGVISKTIKKGIMFFVHCDPYYAHLLPKNNRSRKSIGIFYNALKTDRKQGFLKYLLRRMFNVYRTNCIKNRISVLIKTNKQLAFKNKHTLFMPDYYYSEEKYSKYKCEKQADKVVCLGQNNRYKQIIPLVKKFVGSNYLLTVRGKFFSDDVYLEALRYADGSNNIIIENSNISEEEYYKELATAKYCILPYDTEFYFERTTGVGIEAMFSNCIVIGPDKILQFNDIDGIGYTSIEDLDLALLDKDYNDVLNSYEHKRKNEYSERAAKTTVENAVSLVASRLKQ